MKLHRKTLARVAVLSSVLVLGGCFFDNNDEEVPPPAPPVVTPAAVPDSAGVSGTAFVGFLNGLSATDDSSEPLLVGDTFAVPADDTGEPVPLV